ncbi:fumarylacetoacetate hydrolase family protein [Ornithinibacillus californiensis]|uniref:fumarylacetoacetate hydrolase family protein n=1 Tax=Ornithinibacillus californiensis TaxID=161536 RepID=UPI00064DE0D8|nr:fumarylacetoacetate hydrolase family protein [Ornithinibacillus californiensis]
MRLATILYQEKEQASIVFYEGLLPVKLLNERLNVLWPTDLFELVKTEKLEALIDFIKEKEEMILLKTSSDLIPHQEVNYGPLYRHPGKIWGIGLNYVEHASDLHEVAPNTEPASFMKPDTTIIGQGDAIEIPYQSYRTTAEAELGIIIGKECKNIEPEEVPNVIAGYTTIIDMTAEDILEKNPRYLTRAKSFDTFFSFGPQLVTIDEVEDISKLQVSTVINGEVHRKNIVENMTFKPMDLVSFHSKVMTLKPGDIISTGTPGAIKVSDGDVVECHIDGFTSLVNPVKDLKV